MTSSTGRFWAVISLGSNSQGTWGSPRETLLRAVRELNATVGDVLVISETYRTKPQGGVAQEPYLNLVLVLDVRLSTAILLRKIKTLERSAGRRPGIGRRWGARPLDIDIVDHAGRVSTGWSAKSSATRGKLPSKIILPHPSAHLRAFVLVPLLTIWADWWHPALRLPGKRLLHALPRQDIRSVLELERGPCDGEK